VRRERRVADRPSDLDPTVPAGLDLTLGPGQEAGQLEELQRLIVIDERLRHTDDAARPDGRIVEQHRIREVRLVRRARDRIAVRAGAGVVEEVDDATLDLVVDELLPLGGHRVHLPPGDADDVAEQSRGQSVPAHPPERLVAPGIRELHEVVACGRDPCSSEGADRRRDVVLGVREPTLELVAGGGEPRGIVLDQHLEDLGREVVEVTVGRGESGHIASSQVLSGSEW